MWTQWFSAVTALHVKWLRPAPLFFSNVLFLLFARSACLGFGRIGRQSADGFGRIGWQILSGSPQNKILNDQNCDREEINCNVPWIGFEMVSHLSHVGVYLCVEKSGHLYFTRHTNIGKNHFEFSQTQFSEVNFTKNTDGNISERKRAVREPLMAKQPYLRWNLLGTLINSFRPLFCCFSNFLGVESGLPGPSLSGVGAGIKSKQRLFVDQIKP